jgi:hypothetical protein
MARDGPIAANTAIVAAAKNIEQIIRRHRDGVNVRFGILSFIGVGFVEVWIVQLRDFAFHASIPETEGEVPNYFASAVADQPSREASIFATSYAEATARQESSDVTRRRVERLWRTSRQAEESRQTGKSKADELAAQLD